MAKPTNEKLADLLEKEAQIRAQIQTLKQRENEVERKKDTRRKILIGGAILAKIKSGEWKEKQLHELLNPILKAERDRELFNLPTITPIEATTDGKDNDGGNRP